MSIGLAVGLLYWFWPTAETSSSDGSRSDSASADAITSERIAPGTPGPAAALWLFGFSTLRMDTDDLSGIGVLAERGFGEVASAPGVVYFYDPGSGRVGELDAAANTFRDLVTVAANTTGDDLDGLAVTDESVWIRTGARTVRAIDRVSLAVGPDIDLGVAFAEPAHLTTNDKGLWATGVTGGVATTVFVSPAGVVSVPRVLGPLETVTAVTTGPTHIWVSAPERVLVAGLGADDEATAVDTDTAVVALDADGSTAYGLDLDGAVVAIGTDGEADTITDSLVPEVTRPVRAPAQVIADDEGVHVLVRDDPDVDGQRVRVTRVHRDGTIVASVRIPSDVFIGRMATT